MRITDLILFTLFAGLAATAGNDDTSSRGHLHSAHRSDAMAPQDEAVASASSVATLKPVTWGMSRPRIASPRLALAASKAMAARDALAPRPAEITIDVLVAFTRRAAGHYHDIEGDLIEPFIKEANRSFQLSNIGHIRLRLVHAYRTEYVEEGMHFDHLWRFADKGDGHMEEVHDRRDMYRADLSVLIVDDPKGCGLATRIMADAEEAFAVAHHACAAHNYTVAHEIGHLIGASHDLSYVNGAKWRDIMGAKDSCGGCPRLPIWSSPTVLIDGEPAGTSVLDNARVIAQQAARVAAFR